MATRSEIRMETWRARLCAWQASKKPAPVWCREQHIPYTTFQSWRRRLLKERGHIQGFIEISDPQPQHPGVVLCKGSWRIELQAHFDADALARILEVMEACS